jgi:RNA polymerase sigma-70 factor (ECF subfamily)
MKGPDHSSGRGACSPPGRSTSATLLEQVKQGDSAGWQRLMSLYRPLVLWWCRGKVAGREDAEDVAQEVLTTVFTRVCEFERQRPGSFRAWLKGITRHKLLEHWKQARHRPAAAGGSEAREALEQCPELRLEQSTADDDASERRILLRSALELVRGDFEPSTWEAAIRTIDGQPPAGVAADLGLTRAAVYVAKSRVLARLRQEVGNMLD